MQLLLNGKAGEYASTFQRYQAKAEYYLCAAIHKNHGMQMPKTPGMLLQASISLICSHTCHDLGVTVQSGLNGSLLNKQASAIAMCIIYKTVFI